jgi:hypothetical protein
MGLTGAKAIPVVELVAIRIVELAVAGEFDPDKLTDIVLASSTCSGDGGASRLMSSGFFPRCCHRLRHTDRARRGTLGQRHHLALQRPTAPRRGAVLAERLGRDVH